MIVRRWNQTLIAVLWWIAGARFLEARNRTSQAQAVSIIFNDYDKHTRPYSTAGQPVNITVNMRINSVFDVREEAMDYTMRFAFRQKWRDPRLTYNISLTRGQGHPYIQLETADLIWYPDTFFMNARKSYIHDVTKKNLGIRLFPDGSIYMSQKITVTAECQMDLRKFPMDTQVCVLQFESFFHTAAEIVLRWEEGDTPVAISKDMNLPHFDIVGLETKQIYNVYKSGKFNSLEVHITFRRRLGYYLIQTYLPCVFLCFLSWMPFWMDPSETGDRLAVGITAVLTIVFLAGAMNTNMPKVSYMKAIDWYVIACFLTMVLSFVESMLVFRMVVHSREKKDLEDEVDWGVTPTRRKEISESEEDLRQLSEAMEPTANGEVRARMINTAKTRLVKLPPAPLISFRGRRNRRGYLIIKSNSIDRVSHVLFPGAFILFNVVYWMMYLN